MTETHGAEAARLIDIEAKPLEERAAAYVELHDELSDALAG